jgi:hypothetical protein
VLLRNVGGSPPELPDSEFVIREAFAWFGFEASCVTPPLLSRFPARRGWTITLHLWQSCRMQSRSDS